jgi:hypothetical protein
MVHRITDRILSRVAPRWRNDADMQRFGIARLRAFAKGYNRWRYASRERQHCEAFEQDFPSLLANGGSGACEWPPRLTLKDGWARDDSMTLPHIGRVLEQASEIIAERGGRKHYQIQQPFLRSLLFPGDLEKYPALLDFILSPEMLAIVAHHLQTVPVLSKNFPPGVRFMESNAALDPDWDGPYRESQLYHLDLHDTRVVYVLVLAEDVDENSGPWTFLPASVSARATAALRYQQPGVPYRVLDEDMYRVVDPAEVISFTGKKGSVLFIDSSTCFHYGSRRAIRPRYQLMYGLTTPCRCDLFQTLFENKYPIPDDASRLRRMVSAPWRHLPNEL